MKRLLNNIKPQHFFLVASIILGILYNIITPPLQAPDEHDHFRRVYHISTGHFLPEKFGNRLGGEVPVSFAEYVLPYRFAATNLRYTINKKTYAESFKVALNDTVREFNDFPNTSYYNPVSYLPQVLAVFMARKLNLSNASLYYFGRIFAYLFWMLCMYFLIKTIPVGKWLFTFLLLLPMNVFISNSFSADLMTNILSLAFIVLVLKYAFDEKLFTAKRLLILVLIGVLLALSKVVYVGLVLSFFIIPIAKFNSKKHFFIYSLILFSACFIAAFFWSGVVVKFFTPYYNYDPQFRDYCCLSRCANYDEQKKLILSNGTYFLKVIYRSLAEHPHTYLKGYTGSLGNNDIPLPGWVHIISYAFIFLAALTEKNSVALSFRQKIILIFSACASFVLLLLSQHLTWDCVGEGIVDIVQGRYLIPLFPLLFFAFTNASEKFRIHLPVFVGLMVSVGNYYGLSKIYKRYLTENYISKVEFECGAEQLNEKGFFITSHPKITLESLGAKNDSVARTGKSSVLLYEKTPYSFTYRFKDLHRGDLIEVTAWQKGTGAQMVVNGKGKFCGEFYFPFQNIAHRGKDGWDKMHYAFTINLNCGPADSVEAGFFMWNTGKNKTYIDDLKFSIKKFDDNYAD